MESKSESSMASASVPTLSSCPNFPQWWSGRRKIKENLPSSGLLPQWFIPAMQSLLGQLAAHWFYFQTIIFYIIIQLCILYNIIYYMLSVHNNYGYPNPMDFSQLLCQCLERTFIWLQLSVEKGRMSTNWNKLGYRPEMGYNGAEIKEAVVYWNGKSLGSIVKGSQVQCHMTVTLVLFNLWSPPCECWN